MSDRRGLGLNTAACSIPAIDADDDEDEDCLMAPAKHPPVSRQQQPRQFIMRIATGDGTHRDSKLMPLDALLHVAPPVVTALELSSAEAVETPRAHSQNLLAPTDQQPSWQWILGTGLLPILLVVFQEWKLFHASDVAAALDAFARLWVVADNSRGDDDIPRTPINTTEVGALFRTAAMQRVFGALAHHPRHPAPLYVMSIVARKFGMRTISEQTTSAIAATYKGMTFEQITERIGRVLGGGGVVGIDSGGGSGRSRRRGGGRGKESGGNRVAATDSVADSVADGGR